MIIALALAAAPEPSWAPDGHTLFGVDERGAPWVGPHRIGTAQPLSGDTPPIEGVRAALADPRGPVVLLARPERVDEVVFVGVARHAHSDPTLHALTRGPGDEVWAWGHSTLQPVSAARGLLPPIDAGCPMQRVVGVAWDERALVVCDDGGARWVDRGGAVTLTDLPADALLSPDGTELLVGGPTPTWTHLPSGRSRALPDQAARSPIAWSDDGRRVVWRSPRDWGVGAPTRRQFTPLEGPPAAFAAFSPDGRALWGGRGRLVIRYDTASGAADVHVTHHGDVARALVGSEAEGLLVTATEAGERIVWRRGAEPLHLALPAAWRAPGATPGPGARSADGRRLVTTSVVNFDGGAAEVVDAHTGQSLRVFSVDASEPGPHVAVRVVPGDRPGAFDGPDERELVAPALSDDGARLLTVGWVPSRPTFPGPPLVRLWDVDTGALLRSFTFEVWVHHVWFAEGRFHIRAGSSQLGVTIDREPVAEDVRAEDVALPELDRGDELPLGWTPGG
jgi:hypothetical protein